MLAREEVLPDDDGFLEVVFMLLEGLLESSSYFLSLCPSDSFMSCNRASPSNPIAFDPKLILEELEDLLSGKMTEDGESKVSSSGSKKLAG